jgi:hypothetical protein
LAITPREGILISVRIFVETKMKKWFFTLIGIALALTACGGESFSTALETTTADGGLETATDVGTGGAPALEAGAGGATGGRRGVKDPDAGKPGSGGSPSTGGTVAATGGAPSGSGGKPSTGGVPNATGGSLSTGGVPSTGGAVDAGCTLVTHNNGLGQTWTDCAPLGTYNLEQAMKACAASFHGCYANGPDGQCQSTGSAVAEVGSQTYLWVYVSQGATPGDVIEFTSGTFKCSSPPGAASTWN